VFWKCETDGLAEIQLFTVEFCRKTAMKTRLVLSVLTALFAFTGVYPQEKYFSTGGYTRSGLFLSTGNYENTINAVFADAAIKLDAGNNTSFKGFADIRLRTGQQYGKSLSVTDIREAWVSYYNSWFGFSAGKRIIKWGKTDFFTPLSKFNPVDYSFRSPDPEDADMGEITGEFYITPIRGFKVTIAASPLWNPSVLITGPMKLPGYIHLTMPYGFQAGNKNYSLGIRVTATVRNTDIGIQWFHSTDPMPGLRLDSADFSDIYNPHISIRGVPYREECAGADFESAISEFVLRGAVSWSGPAADKKSNEWVPFSQAEFVLGADYNPGNIHLTAEYSAKKITNFYPSPYPPLLGTNPSLAEMIILFSTPGFDPVEYSRLQTEAFNRLYNNQLKEYYHLAGLRIEYDLFYGKLTPSLTTLYNFTSGDLFLYPSVEYKPADGISFTAGAENYSGKRGSLYRIIDNFMNVVFASVKISF